MADNIFKFLMKCTDTKWDDFAYAIFFGGAAVLALHSLLKLLSRRVVLVPDLPRRAGRDTHLFQSYRAARGKTR